MTGPRAGRRGCGWRRCRWPGTPIRNVSRPSSVAASARSPSTCWLRSWSGRANRPGGCCCGPPMLERVNGELADLLTGGSGGERVLQQLEEAGAFVVSLDARRSWFRYHQLFADLLQLELRGERAGRTARAARCRRRVVRGTRVSRRGGPARSGRAELAPGRPRAVGPLGRPGPGRAGRHRARVPRPLPGRRDRRGCRAGGSGGWGPAGPGIAGRGRTVPGCFHPGTGVGSRGPARARAGGTRRGAHAPGPSARGPPGRGRGGAAAAGPRDDRRIRSARGGRRPAGAGADQPRHRRALDISLRRGGPAPRGRHRPGAPRSDGPIWRSPAWRTRRS